MYRHRAGHTSQSTVTPGRNGWFKKEHLTGLMRCRSRPSAKTVWGKGFLAAGVTGLVWIWSGNCCWVAAGRSCPRDSQWEAELREWERPEWANSDAQAFGHSVTMLALFLNFLSSVKGNFYCDLTLKQKRIWLKCLGTLTFKMWTWKMVKLQSEFCICTHVGTWWYRRLISLPLAQSALSAVQSWGGRNYSSHSPWKLGFWMRFRLCQQDELWETLVRNKVTWRQRTSVEIWSGRELQEERRVGCRAPIGWHSSCWSWYSFCASSLVVPFNLAEAEWCSGVI